MSYTPGLLFVFISFLIIMTVYFIAKWKEIDEYPGLKSEEMPQGAKEVERIVIYTRKNCRGVF